MRSRAFPRSRPSGNPHSWAHEPGVGALLIDFFDHGAMLRGDGACLIDGDTGETRSYRTVQALSCQIANGLRAEGFRDGDKAAVISPNDPLAFIATLGIVRAGLIWIPINPRLSVDEIALILNRLDCDVVFYHDIFISALERFQSEAPRIRRYIRIDGAGTEALEQWAAPYPSSKPERSDDPDAVAALQPTGGTTGMPKAVMMSHRGFEYMVASMFACVPHQGVPVYLAAAPLTHAAGIMMHFYLACGAATVVLPRPDPQAIMTAIDRWRVTHATLVPTILYSLLAQPNRSKFDYGSLQFVGCGGAPASPDRLAEAIEIFGPVLGQMYAQTESMVPITYLGPDDLFNDGKVAPRARFLSCGRPVPFCRLELMDNDGRLVGPGEVGEMVVRHSGLMAGYYKDPEATAEVMRDGWLHTGDLAKRDEDGYYTIIDRKKDMIISGGFNVFCVEVEAVVSSHPAVQDCAVIGVPDDKWGEAVVGFVERKAGASASAEEILAYCRPRLGGVKTPKRIEFVDSLPRSPVGKILKRDLRAKYWVGRERQV
jgi:acyl-CoA synthetase (AMP-forming)/AMP-acid ligase II